MQRRPSQTPDTAEIVADDVDRRGVERFEQGAQVASVPIDRVLEISWLVTLAVPGHVRRNAPG
jgi:propanediol dehydratase small subunit